MKCETSGKVYPFGMLTLLKGTAGSTETAPNGLTLTKYACPDCGASVDLYPEADGISGKIRWHERKGMREGSTRTKGPIPVSVFVQQMAVSAVSGGDVFVQTAAYCAERLNTLKDKREAIAALVADVEKQETEIRDGFKALAVLAPFVPTDKREDFSKLFELPESGTHTAPLTVE